jgi:hypothetical protein
MGVGLGLVLISIVGWFHEVGLDYYLGCSLGLSASDRVVEKHVCESDDEPKTLTLLSLFRFMAREQSPTVVSSRFDSLDQGCR